jgi:hypothetical protein
MKKAMRVLATISIFASSLISTSSAVAWVDSNLAVATISGQDNQYGLSIASDASGNIYTSGSFEGTTVFGSGAGATILTSKGGRDAFVAKHDSFGNLLWVKSFGGPLTDQVKDVVVDRDGNVVMAGEFYGTVDLDPGVGVDSMTALANSGSNPQWNWLGVVVWKLNSDGNYLWAKTYDGPLFDTGVSVAVDNNGNIAITGVVTGSVDLDPSPGRTLEPTPLGGDGDVFVSTFKPSGELMWAQRFGSLGYDTGESVAFDSDGALYVSGSFQRTADFNPGDREESLTAVGSDSNPKDVFISKFNALGEFQWVKQYKGYGDGDRPATVSVGIDDYVYLSGDFNGELVFYTNVDKQDTFTVSSVGTRDGFISKWNRIGSHVWTKRIGSSGGAIYGVTTAIDSSGNIFTTGSETGTVVLDSGNGIITISSAGDKDIFISKLNSSGNFVWVKSLGSRAEDSGLGIAVDISGNVYFTGYFNGEADLDPTNEVKNFLSVGAKDIFISKLNPDGSALINSMIPTPGEIAAQVAAKKAAATKAAAEAAAAKAASEAVAAKREAEKQAARSDIAAAVKNAKDLTVDSFAKAEIAGVNPSNIEALKAELLALPEESRTDFNQVLKVARKFEVVGNIASDQVQNILPNTFVEVGLISQTSKNKVALVSAVKKLPSAARDSYAEIKAAIEAETKRIQARQDRLALVIARNAARSGK